VARPQLIEEFLPKVEEWIDRSNGQLRADRAHDKLAALGFQNSGHRGWVLARIPL
jgi:hypothetical protein